MEKNNNIDSEGQGSRQKKPGSTGSEERLIERRSILTSAGMLGLALPVISAQVSAEPSGKERQRIRKLIQAQKQRHGKIMGIRRQNTDREIAIENGPFVVNIAYEDGFSDQFLFRYPEEDQFVINFGDVEYTRSLTSQDKNRIDQAHDQAVDRLQQARLRQTKRTNDRYRRD